ncbi:hypothetical protein [Rhodococcus pyridinivorans]|nr:hypothetical protein [Rhodococcus pyridinivorans]
MSQSGGDAEIYCEWFHGCTQLAADVAMHPILGMLRVCSEHLKWAN